MRTTVTFGAFAHPLLLCSPQTLPSPPVLYFIGINRGIGMVSSEASDHLAAQEATGHREDKDC